MEQYQSNDGCASPPSKKQFSSAVNDFIGKDSAEMTELERESIFKMICMEEKQLTLTNEKEDGESTQIKLQNMIIEQVEEISQHSHEAMLESF